MNESGELEHKSKPLRNDHDQMFSALIPFMIAVPCLITAAILWFLSPLQKGPYSIIFGIIVAVLVFDLPACLIVGIQWLATGKPAGLSLSPLIPCREEREFHRNLHNRPKLNDDEFYDTFYADSRIPKHLTIQLRRSLENAYGFDFGALHPTDNLIYADVEIDLFDIIFRVSREIDIIVPDDRIKKLDGTFGSLLRCISEISSCTEDK